MTIKMKETEGFNGMYVDGEDNLRKVLEILKDWSVNIFKVDEKMFLVSSNNLVGSFPVIKQRKLKEVITDIRFQGYKTGTAEYYMEKHDIKRESGFHYLVDRKKEKLLKIKHSDKRVAYGSFNYNNFDINLNKGKEAEAPINKLSEIKFGKFKKEYL